ncbi:MAG: tagatose 1,6-diphosphate aldolase [Litoreibacter sp.]|nr:tagatose 1,6-diphosphate aldolase [Litoreibacter sp.]
MVELTAGKLWGMRRMADEAGIFKMTAVDQRPPIKGPIAAHYGTHEAPYDDVARFKSMLVETLQGASSAMLLDPHYAIPRGLKHLSPTKGLIVTLENSVFEDTGRGRRSSSIDDWSVAKIKRMGGDAVKVLAWYRPDADPAINQHQQDWTQSIGEACAKYDIPFLFELLVYPLDSDAEQTQDYVEMNTKRADDVLRSVEAFTAPDFGIDVFKLESPVAAKSIAQTDGVQALFDEMGRIAGRPWVMLSAGAGKPEFKRVLEHAYKAGASGFLAGRAIWLDAFQAFPDWAAIEDGLTGESTAYMAEIAALTDAHATPWHTHPCYGPEGPQFRPDDASFRHGYEGI